MAGQGDVFRVPRRVQAAAASAADDQDRERVRVSFPEAQARYWRVEVLNRNDSPMADLQIGLFGTPRRVVFRPEPDRTYRLAFGHPRAEPAQYDMARLIPANELESAAEATLGAVAANPAWIDPAPWTERHPVVLWAAAIAAAAALGALALKALRL
jgi:hypothetical protein